MSIRRTGVLLLCVLLVPGAAYATGHNMEASWGFTGASGSSFWGFRTSFGKSMPNKVKLPEKVARKLTLLVDASIYGGSENGKDQTLWGPMFGGRWTFCKDPDQKATVSAHGLVGTLKGPDGHPDSYATGLTVDLIMGSKNSSENGMGVRFTVDYITRRGAATNLKRASIELVKRFGHKE